MRNFDHMSGLSIRLARNAMLFACLISDRPFSHMERYWYTRPAFSRFHAIISSSRCVTAACFPRRHGQSPPRSSRLGEPSSATLSRASMVPLFSSNCFAVALAWASPTLPSDAPSRRDHAPPMSPTFPGTTTAVLSRASLPKASALLLRHAEADSSCAASWPCSMLRATASMPAAVALAFSRIASASPLARLMFSARRASRPG